MVIMYIIGLVGVIGILFIIWIERSGQAGPYRTLVNQLVTHNYQAVNKFKFQNEKVQSICKFYKCIFQFLPYYCLGNSFDTFRSIYGSLPKGICWVGILSKNWSHYAILFYTVAITLTKFTYIVIFKSMPTMDDDFILIFFSMTINLAVIVIISLRMILPGKEPLAMVR